MARTDEHPDDPTVDPDQLQRQLTEIKGAIGLEDRYPGKRRLWLVYGALVGGACLTMQAVFSVPDVPGWTITATWASFVVIAGVVQWRLAAGTPNESVRAAPGWPALLGTLALAFVSLASLAGPLLGTAGRSLGYGTVEYSRLGGSFAFGLVVVFVGLGLLFAGNALRAYRIRRRDRWVFYGAGVWMLVYAGAMTHVVLLRTLGYGLFGLLFALYAVGAYLFLGRSTADP
jgi:hypothetical protein